MDIAGWSKQAQNDLTADFQEIARFTNNKSETSLTSVIYLEFKTIMVIVYNSMQSSIAGYMIFCNFAVLLGRVMPRAER